MSQDIRNQPGYNRGRQKRQRGRRGPGDDQQQGPQSGTPLPNRQRPATAGPVRSPVERLAEQTEQLSLSPAQTVQSSNVRPGTAQGSRRGGQGPRPQTAVPAPSQRSQPSIASSASLSPQTSTPAVPATVRPSSASTAPSVSQSSSQQPRGATSAIPAVAPSSSSIIPPSSSALVPVSIPDIKTAPSVPDVKQAPSTSSTSLSVTAAPIGFTRAQQPGKVGQKVQLGTNMFKITLPAKPPALYHYDVTIESLREPRGKGEQPSGREGKDEKLQAKEVKAAGLTSRITRAALTQLGAVGAWSDGKKNIFSAKPLQSTTVQVLNVFDPEESEEKGPPTIGAKKAPGTTIRVGKQYRVTIRSTEAYIDLTTINDYMQGKGVELPRTALQALDVLMRWNLAQKYLSIGRSIFYPADPIMNHLIDGALTIGFGHWQSVRTCQAGLLLNRDLTSVAFLQSGPVTQYLAAALGLRDMSGKIDQRMYRKMVTLMRGVRVRVTHRGTQKRKYLVNGLSQVAADQIKFMWKDSSKPNAPEKEIDLLSYFKMQYPTVRVVPHLPCLSVGNATKPTYLPIEVCEIVEGQKAGRMTPDQKAAMVENTATVPQERRHYIQQTFPDSKSDPYMKGIGAHVSKEAVVVTGRVLPSPDLSYLDLSERKLVTKRPSNGQWDIKGVHYSQTVEAKHCVVLYFDSREQQSVQQFYANLQRTAATKGVRLPPPQQVRCELVAKTEDAVQKKLRALAQAAPGAKPFVLCFLKTKRDPLYGFIKAVSETELGVTTQCFNTETALNPKKGGTVYQENISLKINAKLGGVNQRVFPHVPLCKEQRIMVFGADVHHPGIGNHVSASIAAVVGSTDTQCSQYATWVSPQTHRVEPIQKMEIAVTELLKKHQTEMKSLPQHLVMFRDGVGESQFEYILSHELAAMKAACLKVQANYRPPITFIIVQKRHHVRMYPEDAKQADKNGNMLPGTVVDSGITHAVDHDYYLCSHPGMKGTSKPTHYFIYDERKPALTNDQLQEMTYALCHMNVRSTKSCSLPAPALYAHLAAYRARLYPSGRDEDADFEQGPTQTPTGRAVVPLPAFLSRLWYC